MVPTGDVNGNTGDGSADHVMADSQASDMSIPCGQL